MKIDLPFVSTMVCNFLVAMALLRFVASRHSSNVECLMAGVFWLGTSMLFAAFFRFTA